MNDESSVITALEFLTTWRSNKELLMIGDDCQPCCLANRSITLILHAITLELTFLSIQEEADDTASPKVETGTPIIDSKRVLLRPHAPLDRPPLRAQIVPLRIFHMTLAVRSVEFQDAVPSLRKLGAPPIRGFPRNSTAQASSPDQGGPGSI